MKKEEKSLLSLIPIRGLIFPIIFGLGITYYIAKRHSGLKGQNIFSLESINLGYLLGAFLLVFLRDLFYALRLRELTDKKCSLVKYIMIIMLWDFASALTPSVAGGGVVVIFLLTREGIKFGVSLASIMLATIVDNLVFFSLSPLGFLSIQNLKNNDLDEFINISSRFGISTVFIFGLLILIAYTLFIFFSLLINPDFAKNLLVKITSNIKFLKKWKEAAGHHGDNLVLASKAIKDKKKKFWIKIVLYTVIALSLRYSILNSTMASVMNLNIKEILTSIGNQVILWVVMLISPTPGSAGSAEFFFDSLFFDLLGENSLRVQVFWRFFTYYINIIMGSLVLVWYIKKYKIKKM